VIKIIKNCAETIQLHPLLLQREFITHLIRLVERALSDNFLERIQQRAFQQLQTSNSQQLQVQTSSTIPQAVQGILHSVSNSKELEKDAQEKKRSLILPILRTFICLSETPEFHWHLTKHNTLDLLNNVQLKDDEKIGELAK